MSDNRAAVESADLVLFAVKPWLLEEIAAGVRDVLDYRRQQVASVVAGVSFERLTEMLDNGSGIAPVLYRIIPNTAISLGRSVTFIAHSGATGEQLNAVVAMFDQLGRTFVVTEEMMTAGTSLASCGIAFALKYIDASIRGGVELGFSAAESREVVMQTMRGALALLECNARRHYAQGTGSHDEGRFRRRGAGRIARKPVEPARRDRREIEKEFKRKEARRRFYGTISIRTGGCQGGQQCADEG